MQPLDKRTQRFTVLQRVVKIEPEDPVVHTGNEVERLVPSLREVVLPHEAMYEKLGIRLVELLRVELLLRIPVDKDAVNVTFQGAHAALPASGIDLPASDDRG